MKRVPEEHRAARDLQHQFLELAAARAPRSVARRRWWRRRGGRGVLAVGVAIAAGAGVATATGTFTHQQRTPAPEARPPDDVRGAARDQRLSPITSADPGGGPAWGALSYVNRSGATCVVVGRRVDGRLGTIGNGQFVPYDPQKPGSCGSKGQAVYVAVRRHGSAIGARIVIYGFVTRQIRSLTFTTGEAPRAVPIGDDGLFLLVLGQQRLGPRTTLTARTGTGRALVQPLA